MRVCAVSTPRLLETDPDPPPAVPSKMPQEPTEALDGGARADCPTPVHAGKGHALDPTRAQGGTSRDGTALTSPAYPQMLNARTATRLHWTRTNPLLARRAAP